MQLIYSKELLLLFLIILLKEKSKIIYPQCKIAVVKVADARELIICIIMWFFASNDNIPGGGGCSKANSFDKKKKPK